MCGPGADGCDRAASGLWIQRSQPPCVLRPANQYPSTCSCHPGSLTEQPLRILAQPHGLKLSAAATNELQGVVSERLNTDQAVDIRGQLRAGRCKCAPVSDDHKRFAGFADTLNQAIPAGEQIRGVRARGISMSAMNARSKRQSLRQPEPPRLPPAATATQAGAACDRDNQWNQNGRIQGRKALSAARRQSRQKRTANATR